jgi:GNAT superfamily N-acetyltransferase
MPLSLSSPLLMTVDSPPLTHFVDPHDTGETEAFVITYAFDAKANRFRAFATGTEVGHLEVVQEGDGSHWLREIEVRPAYQRCGIGRELVRHAVARYGDQFRLAVLGKSGVHDYCLTRAAMALANRCLLLGIITPVHIGHIPPAT